jgi:hypothetical protein
MRYYIVVNDIVGAMVIPRNPREFASDTEAIEHAKEFAFEPNVVVDVWDKENMARPIFTVPAAG